MTVNKHHHLYSGTSGLVLPFPKHSFPPEFQDKSRLTYYASLFNSIEINSSFYKVPMASTIGKWAENVPDTFRFTFKLWREITHNKELIFREEDISRFMQVISNAGDKKGSLLVQFPPSLTIACIQQFEKLLSEIRHSDPMQQWDVAIEFRNRSWYITEVFDLIETYKMNIVMQDMPASASPFRDETAEFIYLRFHGPNGSYKGSYPDDFLYEYAQYIKDWMIEGKKIYVYFNNTMGEAIRNLNTLNKFIAQD